MTDREKLVGIMGELPTVFCDCCGEDYLQDKMLWLADHLIANGVTVQEPIRKAEDCRCYTKTNYGGVCFGTKELDPCKGDKCENWKPKEE